MSDWILGVEVEVPMFVVGAGSGSGNGRLVQLRRQGSIFTVHLSLALILTCCLFHDKCVSS